MARCGLHTLFSYLTCFNRCGFLTFGFSAVVVWKTIHFRLLTVTMWLVPEFVVNSTDSFRRKALTDDQLVKIATILGRPSRQVVIVDDALINDGVVSINPNVPPQLACVRCSFLCFWLNTYVPVVHQDNVRRENMLVTIAFPSSIHITRKTSFEIAK